MEHFALGRPVWGPVGEKVLKMNSKWRLHGSVGGVWDPKVAPKGEQDGQKGPRMRPLEGSGPSF